MVCGPLPGVVRTPWAPDVSAASRALLLIGLCEGDPGMFHKPATRTLVSKSTGLEGHWHAWCPSDFHAVPVADWLEPSSSHTVLLGSPATWPWSEWDTGAVLRLSGPEPPAWCCLSRPRPGPGSRGSACRAATLVLVTAVVTTGGYVPALALCPAFSKLHFSNPHTV